jgi:hypothetical protein
MVLRRAWIIVSAACLLAALAIVASAELFVRDPNPVIHVRWQEPLDAARRTALERRFSLHRLEQIAPTAWRYEVTDPSPENIGGLVRHTDVADTHYIDRTRFEIMHDAPTGVRRPGPLGERWPALAYRLVDQAPIVLLALAATTALRAARPHLVSAAALRALPSRGIPPLSPRGLAVFRFVFGVVLALYVYAQPFPADVVPPHLQRTDVPLADWAPIQWLAEHPPIVRAGQWIGISSAVLFAIGILPRLLYGVAVAGIVQWLLAFSLQSDSHPFGLLLLPLLCLLVVPWGDAPPVFRLPGRIPTSAGRPDIRYGYAPWLLSVALGVAWAGAAWAKVREGPGWILNGSVRYHFVSDSSHAPVDWGLALATMPLVAVILSAGAVLIEALTLSVAFVRMPMLRLAMGLAATSVLASFYLFQGILWPAWWILLLGFLPWHWFDRSANVSGQRRASTVSRGQLLCILGLALQQILISAAFIELPPVASRYDMYAKTHASPEDYERENPSVGRHILAEDGRGIRTDLTACASNLSEPIWAILGTLEPGAPPPSTAPLKACHAEDSAPQRYLLMEDRCPFDWNAGGFSCVYRDKLIATLPVSD